MERPKHAHRARSKCLEHGKILKPSTGKCNDCESIVDEEDLTAKEQLVKWSDALYLPTANKTKKQLCKQLLAYLAQHGGEISDLLGDVNYRFPRAVKEVKEKMKQVAKEITKEEAIKKLQEMHPENVLIQSLAAQLEHAKLQEAKAQQLVREPAEKKFVEEIVYPQFLPVQSENIPGVEAITDGKGNVQIKYQGQVMRQDSDVRNFREFPVGSQGAFWYVDGKGKYVVVSKTFDDKDVIYAFTLPEGEYVIKTTPYSLVTNRGNAIIIIFRRIMSNAIFEPHLEWFRGLSAEDQAKAMKQNAQPLNFQK